MQILVRELGQTYGLTDGWTNATTYIISLASWSIICTKDSAPWPPPLYPPLTNRHKGKSMSVIMGFWGEPRTAVNQLLI